VRGFKKFLKKEFGKEEKVRYLCTPKTKQGSENRKDWKRREVEIPLMIGIEGKALTIKTFFE